MRLHVAVASKRARGGTCAAPVERVGAWERVMGQFLGLQLKEVDSTVPK